MRRTTGRLVAPLIVLFAAAAAHAAPLLSLEMDQSPASLGWSVLPGSTPGTHSVADGLLTINSPSYYEFHAPSSLIQSLSNSQGWAMDARFKFTGGNNDMVLWIWDRTKLNKIDVGHTNIRVYPGATGAGDLIFPYNIGTDFHTYHLEAQGEKVRMTVDGNLAFDVTHLAPGGGSAVVSFGDGYESFSTTSVWDYVRFSSLPIPEPAAPLLLGLATAVTAVRRRRPA